MSKKYAIFIVLILISSSQGLQTDQKTVLETDNRIRDINTNSNSIFTTTSNHIQKSSSENEWSKNPDGRPWYVDSDEGYVLVGQKIGGSKAVLYHLNGSKKFELNDNNWVDNVRIIEGENKYFASSTRQFYSVYSESGHRIINDGYEPYTRISSRKAKDVDQDNEEEILVGGSMASQTVTQLREINGDVDWKSEKLEGTNKARFLDDKLLIYSGAKLSLRNPSGEVLWKREVESFSEPVIVDGDIVYSDRGRLMRLSEGNETVDSFETGDLRRLVYLEDYNTVAGVRDGEVVLTDLKSGRIEELGVEGVTDLASTDYYRDGKEELILKNPKKVRVVDLEKEEEKIGRNEKLYGSDYKAGLKALSLNMSVFVTDGGSKKFENATKLENADFSGIESEKKYYAGKGPKTVYVAALASRENASITFDRDEAGRDFSSLSMQEVQELFIEEFRPHHVAVADLESEKGLLTAQMAAEQGVMPVHWNQGYSYPEEKNTEELNRYNSVIQLEEKLEETFERIGENRKTVFEGKYVSILDAPAKVVEDPVDEGLLDDAEDGESFRSDLGYGNLDDDRLLEAGVGRYPEDLSQASMVFHRSRERKIGEKATVASEYMHSNWPIILGTGGGGLRYGSRVESVFRKEDYDTTHLVEQRSDPVEFLVSLTPVELDSFLGEVEDTEDMLKKYVKGSTANMAGNAIVFIKALNYVEQIMEMYYEFQWSTYEIDIDRGMERLNELEVDLDSDREGRLQKSVMKVLYAFVWPERHPEINQSGLSEEMKKSDVIYYQGVGDEERWVMPNSDSSIVKDRYSGEKTFDPSDVPEMERSIVWDNSDLAGARDAEMRDEFFGKGASSFIGYSSLNYPAYSSISGYNFFLRGKTLGNSLKAAVNQLEISGFIYSPSVKSGLREKMTRSIRMYGNPEMEKDPVESGDFTTERECEGNICTLNVSIDLPQKVVEERGQKFLVSNASSYLMEPGAPITPLYSFSGRLPDAELLEVDRNIVSRNVENLTLETYQPLRPGEEVENYSSKDSLDRLSEVSRAGEKTVYSVAGVKKSGDVHEVVERAEVSIRYRSPVVLDFSSENKTLKASINSENEFDAELLYRIDNSTESKDLEIEEGENVFELENVSYGFHELEGYVVKDDVVAHRLESVQIGKDLEVYVFSPEIQEGSSRKITAVVSNPNSFAANKTLSLETSGKVVPGMLEERERTVSISGGEDSRLSWRVFGVEKGKGSVEIRGSNASVNVTSSGDSETFLGTGRFFQVFSSPTGKVRSSVENGVRKLVWKSEEGVLKIKESSDRKEVTLETSDFKIKEVTTSEFELERLENKRGTVERKTEKGVRTVSGNLSESLLERKVELLESESGKVEKVFSLRD